MTEHPSVDDLADAAEGLLDPDRAERVAEHVAGCAHCRQSEAALRQVSRVLAAEPVPPVPPAVAARLGAALAAESAHRAAAGAHPVPAPVRRLTPRPRLSLGHFAGGRHSPPAWRRWAPVLAAAVLAMVVGFGGYVLSATAGLNEPPVVAAAVSSRDLAAQASSIEQSRDLDPHRFSQAWLCARSVTRGRITGLAGALVDGSPALLVYTRTSGVSTVSVVAGCRGSSPSVIASTPLAR